YYNTERPHSSLGYRPPAPEAIIWPAPPRGSAPPSAQAIAEKPDLPPLNALESA
ncbi:MAG: IS3 family transposase, partial [Mesorhizobium sp.]